jgi:hypothetical protein
VRKATRKAQTVPRDVFEGKAGAELLQMCAAVCAGLGREARSVCLGRQLAGTSRKVHGCSVFKRALHCLTNGPSSQ